MAAALRQEFGGRPAPEEAPVMSQVSEVSEVAGRERP